MEAAINEDGIVVEKGVLVTIPKNGYVISGHGKNREFIMNDIELGAQITYDVDSKLLTIKNHLINQNLFLMNEKKKSFRKSSG